MEVFFVQITHATHLHIRHLDSEREVLNPHIQVSVINPKTQAREHEKSFLLDSAFNVDNFIIMEQIDESIKNREEPHYTFFVN